MMQSKDTAAAPGVSNRLMLIINPISGTGNKKGIADMVRERMGALSMEVDVRTTGARGDATRLAREAAEGGYYGVLACGGDGTVNETARGLLSYAAASISEYIQFRPQVYTVSANGKILTEKAFLIAVCNASQYGNNAYIAPHASITDGLLDITIVHSGTPIDTAVMGMDIFTGYINKNTMVHSFRAPAAVIYRSSAGEAHIDGEPIVLDSILDIKCRRGQLKIFTPDNRADFRPIITPVKEMLRDARLGLHHLFSRHILAHLSPDDEADLF